MLEQEARSVYLEFIAEVVTTRVVWSLRCEEDLVVLTGAELGFFPLWPDRESARFFSAQLWPSLTPAELGLKLLLRLHLPSLARVRVPVGVGVAPHPEAIVLEADRLRRDLIVARRAA